MFAIVVGWLESHEIFIRELGILTPIVGTVMSGLWIWRNKSKAAAAIAAHEAETRWFESRRPFLELRLKTYIEISQIVGELVSEPINSDQWKAAAKKFWSFYWSLVSIVESLEIEKIMEAMGKCVETYSATMAAQGKNDLESNVFTLAHQIRREIESDWRGTLPDISSKDRGATRVFSVA